jgi:hypothetical protein
VTSAAPGRALLRILLGWTAVALALGYAVLIHYGVGPSNKGMAWHWYTPRTFLLDIELLYPVFDTLGRALLGTALPAVALAALVFALCRSAWGRALALSSIVATLLFCFYGVRAPFVWEFFHWRASAVLALMALVVGFALAAPLFAASWLRLSWPLRLGVYLPFFFGVFAFVRNATGTDESLRFAISPWPAVPVFGIEVGALFVAAWFAGVGLGLRAIARARAAGAARSAGGLVAGLLLGLALPALLLWLGSQLGLFPFRAGVRTFVGASAVTALAIAASALVRGSGDAAARRARHVLVGAALIGIPLVGSEALARYDYYVTREVRARRIIDALGLYFARETVYPDSLAELVEAKDIDALPEPAIGFGFLYDGRFRYQNFGTSFILEFPAPRWVECAYTPPFTDEDEDEDVAADTGVAADEDAAADADAEEASDAEPEPTADSAADEAAAPVTGDEGAGDEAGEEPDEGESGDGESLDEAWSCPSKPPELW